MKKNFQKITCLLLAGLMGACFAPACGDKETTEKTEDLGYTAESYDFTTVFIDGARKSMEMYDDYAPNENETVVYDIYSNIGNKNYLKMDLETDVNLVGYINYYNNDDPTHTHSEKFYVEEGATQFTTFLDAFRDGAYGAFDKTITTITFKSVDSTKNGNFTFKALGASDRRIETREELFISDGATVLGTSAFYGGCISYLERLDADIYEYMDFDGNICIDKDVDPEAVNIVSSDKVNLINICDLGREVQPSYYSAVDKEHGYDPDYEDIYDGLTGKPTYNPIQCGDYGDHSPQIIDYIYKSDYLYVKMKAQEWFFSNNIQANGYIEATYYFSEGALIVDNRYIDFSEFVGEETVQMHTQETPATYFAYPLNYFYCETKMGTIFDCNINAMNNRSKEKTSLRDGVSGEYFYALQGKTVKDGWCAYVNENKFGVGIYMPNADVYYASRGQTDCNYLHGDDKSNQNRRYYPEFFQFDESQLVPSYATFNYSYINPGIKRKMIDVVPLEYTYALYVGETSEMKTVFDKLGETKVVDNDHLLDAKTGWPKR